MKKENKGFLLQTVPQINRWTAISGLGFLLYLGAAALELRLAADVIAVVFAVTWALARRMPPTFGAVAIQAVVGAAVYGVLLVAWRDPVWQVWRNLRKGGDGGE